MFTDESIQGLDRLFDQALASQQAGDWPRAALIYSQVLEYAPEHVRAMNNLGNVMLSMGYPDEAEACFTRALAAVSGQSPERVELFYNRGRSFQLNGRVDEAIADYSAALALSPQFESAAYNRAIALRESGRIDEAVDAYRALLVIAPRHAHAWNNLGKSLRERGEVVAAIQAFDEAVLHAPDDAEIASNRLFCLLHDDAGRDRVVSAQSAYAARFESRWRRSWPAFEVDRRADRPLRVGFVSADFRDHPVGRFLEPLLAQIDWQQVEPIAFATTDHEDAATARFKSAFEEWHCLGGLDDEMACRVITGCRIDVLFDLSGHTAGNRLGVFARKPAPVQVTWLGYLGSTGLSAMDWRMTDDRCDPEGAEVWHSERLLRLPCSPWCYRPPVDLPVSSRCLESGACDNRGIRFGSFAGAAKLSDYLLSLWARILVDLPGAGLLLGGIPEGWARARIVERLTGAGVAPGAIEFLDRMPTEDYFACLGTVDVVLDSFPYVGGTTTCDALWMGVPVLTLVGDRSWSRSGASLLAAVGLPDWVATTPEEYISKARAWAKAPDRLRKVQEGLREQMIRSPLMDEQGFARDWSLAVRSIWQDGCIGGC